jgi:hypothetical protein
VGTSVYCLAWCEDTADCPLLLDACNSLDPAVFSGTAEQGVCYDGLG